MEFDVTAGTTYYIRVGGFGTSNGHFYLGLIGPQCEYDDCGGATVITDGTYHGTLQGASNDGSASCGASGDIADVWYEYTASCDGTLHVNTCGTHDMLAPNMGMDTVVSVHSGCPGTTGNQLDCNDDWPFGSDSTACAGVDTGINRDSAVAVPVGAGQTVFIRVSKFFGVTPREFVLNVELEGISLPTGSLRNGDFSDTSGLYWCFVDESETGSVDYSSANAVVTGGNDGAGAGVTDTYIEQAFTTFDTAAHIISFDWSYSTVNVPGFDGAFWDLIDIGTGLSVVGGPVTLSVTSGESGTETATFSGSGDYLLRLGTFSTDNVLGPGISTFDDVTITCDATPGPFANGDFSDTSGTPWCFTDESETGSVDYSSASALVTGGDDGLGAGATDTFIQQAFSLGSTAPHDVSFTWSYSSTNVPGFDGAFWDLIDLGTGTSVVSGPITLTETSGDSGTEMATFFGTGDYVIQLGTFTDDNILGPGTSTFDDVVIVLGNDDCVDAEVIGEGTFNGTLVGATNDGSASCGASAANPDVWYEFTAPCNGVLHANTCGTHDAGGQDTGIDTVLSVHSGCPGTTGNQLDCNDDWPGGSDPTACSGTNTGINRDSAVAVPVTVGETVFIRVSKFGGSAVGPFILNVTMECMCQPVTGLTCVLAADDVVLNWTNGDAYTAINVYRDGGLLATLGGAATSHTDVNAPAGVHTYTVEGMCGALVAPGVDCGIFVPCFPVTGLTCVLAGQDVVLNWTNGDAYTAINVSRNGSFLATLLGSATSYTDVSLPAGTYTYTVEGVCDTVVAPGVNCTVIHDPLPDFRRGDANGDGVINALVEAIFLLAFGFQNGPPPPCFEAADTNGDGVLNALVEAIYMLNFGFNNGPPPPSPHPGCGPDPDPMSSLGCDTSPCP